MTLITKPDFTYVWASGGAVVAPNDSKKQLGWVAEAPPFQYDNWLQNRQDQMLAHINQRGIPAWDALTNYEAGGLSYVQGSDGKIYKSVAASGPSATVQNPTTDGTDTYWTVAFADVGAFLTQAAGDTRYTQRSNNLSDLSNVATARTNLSVYSKAETDTRNLNSARIDVASASNVNLTTAAPNTRHINITGTTTINGFTVVAGVTYFVRFNGALTLTNSASLVTQTGANILTAAGDTCIIRATTANVVEVMVYVDATVQSLASNGYRKFKDGMIIQWGQVATASRQVDGTALGPITYPIAFPNAVVSVTAQMIGGESIGLISLDGWLFVKTVSPTSFNLISGFNTNLTFEFGAYWVAIGH